MIWFSRIVAMLFFLLSKQRRGVRAFLTPTISRQQLGPAVPSLPRSTPVLLRDATAHQRQARLSQTFLPAFGKSVVAASAGGVACGLPGWQAVALACIVPTCLGYWKSEYGVSYAYGAAVATTSGLVLKGMELSSPFSLAALHAASLVFYGTRLNLFLLYRELLCPSMRKIRDNIEDKAKKRGSRLQRTPFILGCALLYFGLVSPVLITAQLAPGPDLPPLLFKTMRGLIATSWAGFILAALGDFNKSLVKAWKGSDHLVTGGIFALFRHPNYTGEVVGWTSSFLTAVAAVASVADKGPNLKLAGLLVSSLMGVAGIDFVLAAATNNLEKKQKEKYGKTNEYQRWINHSWPGFMLQTKKEEDSHTEPQLELSPEEIEEGGSGI